MKTSTTDPWENIVNSATLADRPDGVSTLAWLTDLKQRRTGERRTMAAAVRAKIDAHEAAVAARKAKHTASAIVASAIRPTSTSRPATRSTPAPAPQHPHLAKLATLSGDAATLYFRQHRSACIAEEADRQAAIAEAQLKANCRLAKTGRGFNSHI